MTAHTPGPWTVRGIATPSGHYIGPALDGGAPSIGFALARLGSTEAQIYANARLMAAAPDLLAALVLAEAALSDIGDADHEPSDDLAWAEARAAQVIPAVRAALAQAGVR
jgi:hypothetical protein